MPVARGVEFPEDVSRKYFRSLYRGIVEPLKNHIKAPLPHTRFYTFREIQDFLQESKRVSRRLVEISPEPLVKVHFDRLTRSHKEIMRQTFQSFLSVDIEELLEDTPGIRDWVERGIKKNVSLIKTIPPRFHGNLTDVLQSEFREHFADRSWLTKILGERFNATGWDLERLARDQTTKAVGQLTEVRQRGVGVRQYKWQTVGDERVRDTHAAQDGNIYNWDRPPSTGHPGTEIMCRCIAVPILGETCHCKGGGATQTCKCRATPMPEPVNELLPKPERPFVPALGETPLFRVGPEKVSPATLRRDLRNPIQALLRYPEKTQEKIYQLIIGSLKKYPDQSIAKKLRKLTERFRDLSETSFYHIAYSPHYFRLFRHLQGRVIRMLINRKLAGKDLWNVLQLPERAPGELPQHLYGPLSRNVLRMFDQAIREEFDTAVSSALSDTRPALFQFYRIDAQGNRVWLGPRGRYLKPGESLAFMPGESLPLRTSPQRDLRGRYKKPAPDLVYLHVPNAQSIDDVNEFVERMEQAMIRSGNVRIALDEMEDLANRSRSVQHFRNMLRSQGLEIGDLPRADQLRLQTVAQESYEDWVRYIESLSIPEREMWVQLAPVTFQSDLKRRFFRKLPGDPRLLGERLRRELRETPLDEQQESMIRSARAVLDEERREALEETSVLYEYIKQIRKDPDLKREDKRKQINELMNRIRTIQSQAELSWGEFKRVSNARRAYMSRLRRIGKGFYTPAEIRRRKRQAEQRARAKRSKKWRDSASKRWAERKKRQGN